MLDPTTTTDADAFWVAAVPEGYKSKLMRPCGHKEFQDLLYCIRCTSHPKTIYVTWL